MLTENKRRSAWSRLVSAGKRQVPKSPIAQVSPGPEATESRPDCREVTRHILHPPRRLTSHFDDVTRTFQAPEIRSQKRQKKKKGKRKKENRARDERKKEKRDVKKTPIGPMSRTTRPNHQIQLPPFPSTFSFPYHSPIQIPVLTWLVDKNAFWGPKGEETDLPSFSSVFKCLGILQQPSSASHPSKLDCHMTDLHPFPPPFPVTSFQNGRRREMGNRMFRELAAGSDETR